jgi:hypothetical protein
MSTSCKEINVPAFDIEGHVVWVCYRNDVDELKDVLKVALNSKL